MSSGSVTLRDVYEIMQRVEDKVDKKIAELEDKIEKQSLKIDRLEAFNNRTLGVLAVGSAFVSLIATFIWNKIVGHE